MICMLDIDKAYSAKKADTKNINNASHLLEAGAASLAHIIKDNTSPSNAASSISIDQIFKDCSKTDEYTELFNKNK